MSPPRTPAPNPPQDDGEEISRKLHDQVAKVRQTFEQFREQLSGVVAPSSREKAIARDDLQPDDEVDEANVWPDRP